MNSWFVVIIQLNSNLTNVSEEVKNASLKEYQNRALGFDHEIYGYIQSLERGFMQKCKPMREQLLEKLTLLYAINL